MSTEKKRLNRTLRGIRRRLGIRFDDRLGFDPSGGVMGHASDGWTGAADKRPRTAELIGFYLMHADEYPPEVKPHLAGLVLRTLDLDGCPPELSGLVADFLASTRKEWRRAAPLLASRSWWDEGCVFDFVDNDAPARLARRELSKKLNLKFPAHDWESCNADPARAAEFIAYARELFSRMKDNGTDDDALVNNALLLAFCAVDRAIHNKTLDAATREAAQQLLEDQIEPPDERGWRCHRWSLPSRYVREESLLDFTFRGSTNGWGRVKLSDALQLKHPAVDWPCYNAAPERLCEFVKLYFEGWHESQHIDRQIALGSLILASAEALVEQRTLTTAEQEDFERFVQEQRGEQAASLAHWAAYGSRKIVLLVTDAVLTSSGGELVRPWDPNLYTCGEVSKRAEGSELLYYANCALQLNYAGQDWGIINAHAERTVEFIRYYLSRRSKFRCYLGRFEELICASIDRARHERPNDPEITSAAMDFFTASAGSDSAELLYWNRWWASKREPVGVQ